MLKRSLEETSVGRQKRPRLPHHPKVAAGKEAETETEVEVKLLVVALDSRIKNLEHAVLRAFENLDSRLKDVDRKVEYLMHQRRCREEY